VCSVYDVNEMEENEENKRRNTLLLSRVTSLLKGNEKNTLFMCYSKGAVLAPFLEAFVTNCMETLLEAKEGKYLYTY
jgi:hypothetical protein